MKIIETSILPRDDRMSKIVIRIADAEREELANESIGIAVELKLENNPPLLAVQGEALERAQSVICQEIARLKLLSEQSG